MARIRAFYNGIAVLVEKECGLMAVPLVHLSSEGFGRVLITVGKLVVLDRPLRDAHRFGFESLSAMKNEADKYLAVALEIVSAWPGLMMMMSPRPATQAPIAASMGCPRTDWHKTPACRTTASVH